MANEEIRVGLIGAGRNTRERHIPGFQKIQGLEIAAVANRSRESGRAVADQFNIPTVYDNWQELLEDESLNAICIGTWPNMHRTLTVAALEKGKHVMCEARMATSAQEARDMLNASRLRPDLVAQIVPSPFTFKVDGLLQKMIGDGYLGELLSVELQSLGPNFVDTDGPMQWRHDRDLSGYNILNIGIWYEAMIRWVGRATKVMAMSKINVPYRRNENGEMVGVTIPDHTDVLCELANGAQAHMRFSAATGLSTGNEVWLYGSEGTIRLDHRLNVYAGKRGDSALTEVPNPEEGQGYWRVEEEFANAIRGQEQITRTPFDVGVHYMEWTEAVTRSAQTGRAIALPL
ncbi:MAG: Gfo/Idh/MocA family oxidoreductase [Chloroflexi bacterium]|nr:Gfo/Idh/MocA family oxidoreductase [Chloroflexota bacterium]